jgi:hypothetical protein
VCECAISTGYLKAIKVPWLSWTFNAGSGTKVQPPPSSLRKYQPWKDKSTEIVHQLATADNRRPGDILCEDRCGLYRKAYELGLDSTPMVCGCPKFS